MTETNELGRVDLKKTYSTFSGIDTRILTNGKVLPGAQSFKCLYYPESYRSDGDCRAYYLFEIEVLLFSHEHTIDIIADRLHNSRLEVNGANEYGHTAKLVTPGIAYVVEISSCVEIDTQTWMAKIIGKMYPDKRVAND